jgi:hypothetical protein
MIGKLANELTLAVATHLLHEPALLLLTQTCKHLHELLRTPSTVAHLLGRTRDSNVLMGLASYPKWAFDDRVLANVEEVVRGRTHLLTSWAVDHLVYSLWKHAKITQQSEYILPLSKVLCAFVYRKDVTGFANDKKYTLPSSPVRLATHFGIVCDSPEALLQYVGRHGIPFAALLHAALDSWHPGHPERGKAMSLLWAAYGCTAVEPTNIIALMERSIRYGEDEMFSIANIAERLRQEVARCCGVGREKLVDRASWWYARARKQDREVADLVFPDAEDKFFGALLVRAERDRGDAAFRYSLMEEVLLVDQQAKFEDRFSRLLSSGAFDAALDLENRLPILTRLNGSSGEVVDHAFRTLGPTPEHFRIEMLSNPKSFLAVGELAFTHRPQLFQSVSWVDGVLDTVEADIPSLDEWRSSMRPFIQYYLLANSIARKWELPKPFLDSMGRLIARHGIFDGLLESALGIRN